MEVDNHSFVSQAIDEEYLGVDAQFGGVDQRKIFTYAEKVRMDAFWTCVSFAVRKYVNMYTSNTH